MMERDGKTKSKAALLRLTKECFSSDKMSKEAEKAINEAKRRDRPFINVDEELYSLKIGIEMVTTTNI